MEVRKVLANIGESALNSSFIHQKNLCCDGNSHLYFLETESKFDLIDVLQSTR